MAATLYLALTDANGNPVPGSAAAPAVLNPFRANAPILRPFTLTDYTFGVDAPLLTGTGGGGTSSKPNPTELVVQMKDNASTAALFRTICSGTRLSSADVLVVSSGTSPTVVAGVALSTAFVTGLSWAVANSGGIIRTLKLDAIKFAAGSTTPNADGSAGPFTFATFDASNGVTT